MLTLLEWPRSGAIMLAIRSYTHFACRQVVKSLAAAYFEAMGPSRKADVTEFINAICLEEGAKVIAVPSSSIPYPFWWVWTPPMKTLNGFVLIVPASFSTFKNFDTEYCEGNDKNILKINTGPSVTQSLRSSLLHHW